MPSLSLQPYMTGAQPELTAISINPKGFKAAIQSLSNFLVAHQVPATLWLKLPKDDAWWTDIWQYGQQAAGCTIYALGTQTGNPPKNMAASLRPIPIEQDADLKGEYLCMAVAESFVVTMLAVRNSLGGDKRTLNLYYTISGQVVSALSTGIKAIIENSLPSELDRVGSSIQAETGDGSGDNLSKDDLFEDGLSKDGLSKDSAIAGQAALSQWHRLFSPNILLPPTRALDSAFLTWQLQSQADLRSALSSQSKNESSKAIDALSPKFLAEASQELQSPLTTIKTALTLLGSPALKLSQRQLYLEMIATQCDRQKSLIASVFDLLQIQTSPLVPAQPLKLSDMIPGIVSTYQPIAEERGIMLAHTIPPNLTEAMGVESALKEAVIHLIKNGIAIAPKGGRVWVTAATRGTDFVSLNVQDSGAGISQANSSRLFEAFYRSGEGAGLGLTLVKQLIERTGGRVEVDSQPGQGTTFKILLPISRAIPERSSTTLSEQ